MSNCVVSLLFLALFAISGCDKPDPNAYRSDPVLQDYQSQLASTNAQIEALKKQVDEVKKDIKTSVPQAGQAKLHTQKLYEIESRLRALEQQSRFWRIRIESYAQETQKDYLESREKKESWPNKERVESYFAEKRLRQAKMKWDARDRIEQSNKANSPSASQKGN